MNNIVDITRAKKQKKELLLDLNTLLKIKNIFYIWNFALLIIL